MLNLDLLLKMSEHQTRKLDAGQYHKKFSGQEFEVWVNAPGIVEALFGDRGKIIHEETKEIIVKDDKGKVVKGDDGESLKQLVVSQDIRYDPMGQGEEFGRMRAAVKILFSNPENMLTDADIRKIDDDFLRFLFNQGYRLYLEYHDEIKKN